jgi:hypothetical protein
MSLEQLVEDILRINKVFTVLLAVFLVVQRSELVKIVQQLIFQVGNVGRLAAR